MLSDHIVELNNIWKKYSMRDVFHRSLRDDIAGILKRNNDEKLREGEFWALKNINFAVSRGECIGLYGPNGAGKSTILKLIASVTFPNSGEVKVKGKVAPLIEIGAGFHLDLTGRENIFMNGTIIGMTINEIKMKTQDIIRFSELENFIDMPVKKYSLGMYMRLGFSVAIHSSSEILLIDEILSVGDESFQHKCIEKINNLKTNGKTMILVSHDRDLMGKIVDRMIFLNKGEMVISPDHAE